MNKMEEYIKYNPKQIQQQQPSIVDTMSMLQPESFRTNPQLDDFEKVYKLRQDVSRAEDAESEEKALTNLAS